MTSTAAARSKSRKSEVTNYKMYIDGKSVDAKSGKTFDVYDPSTEGVIAKCPAAGAEDVDRAVKAAHRAFYEGWKNVTRRSVGGCSSVWPSESGLGGASWRSSRR